jgi:nicotinamidase-related amidase
VKGSQQLQRAESALRDRISRYHRLMRALLIIDMQRGLLRFEYATLPARIASYARNNEYAVIFASRFTNAPGSLYRSQLDWHKLSGPPATLLVPVIAALDPFEIPKTGYSALTPVLAALLHTGQFDGIDLCGIDTDQCVAATAFALFDAGVDVRILTKLCASSAGPAAHEAGLAALARALGEDALID